MSNRAEMLLTSAGPTTESIQERLLEMATNIHPVSRLQNLRILRIADGWVPFGRSDMVSLPKRAENRVETAASSAWSSRYIKYVLTKASVETQVFGALGGDTVSKLFNRHDMVLVPGGNTFQTIRGLLPHKEEIQNAVNDGRPYVGESAGSVVAGLTTDTATLPPADTAPVCFEPLSAGIGLVEFDIIVHAAGRRGRFEIPGPVSMLSSLVMRTIETPHDTVEIFVQQHGFPVQVLNDCQAIAISGGEVCRI